MRQFWTIVHFQIASSLCFKARPSSKPLKWKLLFILTQIKLVLTTKKCSLSLVFKVRVFQTRKWSIELFGCGRATKHLLQFWKKETFFISIFHIFPSVENWFANFKTFFPEFKTLYKPWPSESNLQETSNCSYLENISYDIYLFYFRGYLLFQPGREGSLSYKITAGLRRESCNPLNFLKTQLRNSLSSLRRSEFGYRSRPEWRTFVRAPGVWHGTTRGLVKMIIMTTIICTLLLRTLKVQNPNVR